MLNWQKQPLTQSLARSLRAATRRHPSLDGHTFGFSDLKEMWSAEDAHVVCTHDHDPVWQYWHQAPNGVWELKSVHDTRQEAQDAAAPHVNPGGPEPGTYVVANFPEGRLMRVRIMSKNGERMLTEIFTGLGCVTACERVKGQAA